MIVSAIKCDFCKKAVETSNSKNLTAGLKPPGWATISPHIVIAGTPQGPNGDEYRKRRDSLREKITRQHICEDCVEEIHTGKISIKLTQGATDERTATH